MWKFIESAPSFVVDAIRGESWHPGSMIVLQGFPEEDIYILTDGVIKVSYALSDGTVFSVATAKEIDILGDTEVLTGRPATMNMVEAVSECELYRLPKPLFLRWLREDNAFCFEVLRLFAVKYDESANRWKYLKGLTLSEQMTLWFYKNRVSASKEDLSEQLMAPVRSINRSVRELCTEGLLTSEKGLVSIRDDQALKCAVNAGKLKNYL